MNLNQLKEINKLDFFAGCAIIGYILHPDAGGLRAEELASDAFNMAKKMIKISNELEKNENKNKKFDLSKRNNY